MTFEEARKKASKFGKEYVNNEHVFHHVRALPVYAKSGVRGCISIRGFRNEEGKAFYGTYYGWISRATNELVYSDTLFISENFELTMQYADAKGAKKRLRELLKILGV